VTWLTARGGAYGAHPRRPSAQAPRQQFPSRRSASGGTRAPTTASLALIALNQVCRFALRRGWLADNPVSRLERGERPRWTPRPVGILEGNDLARMLERAGEHRPMFELLAYTGLPINEALGLRWG